MSETEGSFALDFTGDDLSKATPNDGGGFKRCHFGDYKAKIVNVSQKAKTGAKPHVMLIAEFVMIGAYSDDPKCAASVGMTVNSLYAGSRQSPKFMQDRLANLILACNIKLPPGKQLSSDMFVGREIDVTVTWELGQPSIDPTTGAERRFVNSRILGERPIGKARPANINPAADSQTAVKFLDDKYGSAAPFDGGGAGTMPVVPWAIPEKGASVGFTNPDPPAVPEINGTWRPESEADDNVNTYRAHIAIGGDLGAQAKEALINAGFDPHGPVVVRALESELATKYMAAVKPASTLAPLTPKPTKGKRTPPQAA